MLHIIILFFLRLEAEDIEVSLTSNYILQQIPFDTYPKDFTFIVDGKNYPTSRVEADIISPIIRNLHKNDKDIDCFYINTNNRFPDCNFSDFLQLLTFKPQTINFKMQLYVKYIFLVLGNLDEYRKIKLQYSDLISVTNVIDRILQKQHVFSADELTDEIDFAAIHFKELDKEELKKIDDQVISKILQNTMNHNIDENLILDFITELYLENKSRKYLFESVNFSNVNKDKLIYFFKTLNFYDITPEIWQSIIERILNSPDNKKMKAKQSLNINSNSTVKLFYYDEKKQLNGIIRYLTNKTKEKKYIDDLIQITSSSDQLNDKFKHGPKFLIDLDSLDSQSMWSPDNESNAYLIFDFKSRKVKIANYTFHTPINETNDYPRSWTVDCSNNLVNWYIIDVRKNESVMNKNNVSHTFTCKNEPSEYFRYIRITSDGPCWNGNNRYYFDISAVEFYGFLVEKLFLFPT